MISYSGLASGPVPVQHVVGPSSAPQPPLRGSFGGQGAASVVASGAAAVAAGASLRKGAKSIRGRIAVKDAVKPGHVDLSTLPKTLEINYYKLSDVDRSEILSAVKGALKAMQAILQQTCAPKERLLKMLCEPKIRSMLTSVSQLPVFSFEMGSAFKDNLDLLLALKQIKYFWSIPQSQLVILFEQLAKQLSPEMAPLLAEFGEALLRTPEHTEMIKHLRDELPAEVRSAYLDNAEYLETADAHAVYPTSIYRQCDALTLATEDASTIEAVMSTTLTTTIKIARKVLDPSNTLLSNVYKPLGRCVAVVDDKVEELYGKELEAYFAHHGIEYKKMVFSGNEVDKDIQNVEKILLSLKKSGQGRHEPLLVVGGGVIADIAGFAAALYSRNTPYLMLCTSIVSGIDAGPSPRVCCNGHDYKNLYGAYHPPVLTITDRGFWKSLHPGHVLKLAETSCRAVLPDAHLL